MIIMTRSFVRGVAAALIGLGASSAQAADVGVSVRIGQPGFYGRIDIGDRYPQPVLVYPQPVVIAPSPVAVVQRPIYLRVPPGHEKNWGKHCRRYGACGQRVYFVQDDWYRTAYAPAYRGAHPSHRGHRAEGHAHTQHHGRKHGKGRGRDDD